ncbi:hypothetical protein MHU86_22642 [Fragilaria crotonensis]|nr:hypothetical protein MHU86_22642 [Fragilaria crotonensis]
MSADGTWTEVPIEVATEKICHALRDARLVCNRNAMDRTTRELRKSKAQMLERSPSSRHSVGSRWESELCSTNITEKKCLQQNPVSFQNNQSNGWAGIDSGVSQELILDCQIQSLLRLRRAIVSQQLSDFNLLSNQTSGLSTLLQPQCRPQVPSKGCSAFFEQEPTPMVLSQSENVPPMHAVDQHQLRRYEVSQCPPSRDPRLSLEVTNKLDDGSFTMWQHTDPRRHNRIEENSSPLIQVDRDQTHLNPTRCRISTKLHDQVAPWNALVPQALLERNMDNRSSGSSSSQGSNHDYASSFEDDDDNDNDCLAQMRMDSSPTNPPLPNDRTYDVLKRALDICVDVDVSQD